MSIKRFLTIALVLAITSPLYYCKKDGGGVNIFTLADDKAFGAQTAAQIAADPTTYPVLDSTTYHVAYGHINRIVNKLLSSPKLNHRNDFVWKVKIIKDDNTKNAFCTPGGYIYVYTGIIKYLDKEDQLAGVLGHEIAHADLRHSTDAMTQQYGLQFMLDIVLGKQSQLNSLASNLINLKYSRKHESQADEYSVYYLESTDYKCSGAGDFFQKLLDSNNGSCDMGGFLSTHPCPDDRVAAITAVATKQSCSTSYYTGSTYASFKSSLP